MSRGEVEDRISRALTQWEKEYLGRGSIVARTDVVRNMVIVVLKGVMTPAEQQLASTSEGRVAIKRMRADLVESGSEACKAMVAEITGVDVANFFTDLSTRTGERVMVFMLEHPLR
ncbi:MAG: DUF2294 domain-containing protein [Firmicutes bacterium]|nr:DUF2294 domain-containing protein [Bacillota bacterium]